MGCAHSLWLFQGPEDNEKYEAFTLKRARRKKKTKADKTSNNSSREERSSIPKTISQTSQKGQIPAQTVNSQKASDTQPKRNIGFSQPSSVIPDETFSSIGLKNLGNTCFMNSIIQIFVHLPEIPDHTPVVPNELASLITTIRLKQKKNLIKVLNNFYNWICLSLDYTYRDQQDPKFLFLFLAKQISTQVPKQNLFKWTRVLEFSHPNNHRNLIPDQDFSIFAVQPNNKGEITCAELNKSFDAFGRNEKQIQGYYEKYRKNVIGDEKTIESSLASYAVFHTSAVNARSRIKSINFLYNGGPKFELKGIVMRNGTLRDSCHNYSICKESTWIEYNDERVAPIAESQTLVGVYMLFYKVIAS